MEPEFREAGAADAETVLAFMREFNASQGHAFLEPTARGALLELLESPALGRVWLVLADGFAVGYVVLTLGFRLGVRAVHLEVERTNRAAERLYEALGFGGHERRLLTRRL
jgi:hypothetical protein